MILQRLVELYERRTGPDAEHPLPEPGWSKEPIAFVIELAKDGSVTGVRDLRDPNSKSGARGRVMRVPAPPKRTNNEVACLLWDKPEYALGLPNPKAFEQKEEDPDKRAKLAKDQAERRFRLFRERIEELAQTVHDPGLAALKKFLAGDTVAAVRAAASPETMAALEAQAGNVSFKFAEDPEGLIFDRPLVREALTKAPEGVEATDPAQCCVTGKFGPIARLHPPIKGVSGSQTSGANIISFNKEAFTSFNLAQGANAPVGTWAAFAYTTALNALLARDSAQKTTVGGTTVVFWAGRATANEAVLCPFLAAMSTDDPSRGAERVRALYKAPKTGVPPCIEDDTPFYILGLSAESKSRLTVRFFHEGTIRGVAETVLRWFSELEIVEDKDDREKKRRKGEPDRQSLALSALLRALSVQGDLNNAPPLLSAELLRAAFTGARLPERVLAEAINRCAAERGPTRARAALIKAFLIRNLGEEVTVALDLEEKDTAYRLGRLFAVLERLQQDAVSPNATIRDRYWGAASSMPAYVFPQLLSLATSHLGKLEGDKPGLARWFEKQIGEITSGLPPSLPATLSLVEQGRFAIGYWHQRHTPKTEAAPTPNSNLTTEEEIAQ